MNARTRRPHLPSTLALILCLCGAAPFRVGQAQKNAGRTFRPDTPRALKSRQKTPDFPARAGAYTPRRARKSPPRLARTRSAQQELRERKPARPAAVRRDASKRAEARADTSARKPSPQPRGH